MIKTIKAIYRFVIPSSMQRIVRPIIHIRRTVLQSYLIKTQPKRHQKALEIVRKKKRIKVAFFLIHDSVWKYEGVYKLMKEDERFEPVVIVCPYIVYGEEAMLRDMKQAYESFKIMGYNVIKTLNEETGEWLDVKKDIRPDIVFFTNPWLLTKEEYYITNFKYTLTCYVSYFFHVTKHLKENYSGIMQNLVWKFFLETVKHKQFAIGYSKNKAYNTVITGYPGLDPIVDPSAVQVDPWKLHNRSIKRIIWAPHHTIEGQGAGLMFSNFKRYATFFKELTQKHSSEIQIAFKPHPLLRVKLYGDKEWGKERTDSYFDYWKNLANGLLVEGHYIDLFLTSDALIHDSGSFIVEYLATGKPCLYTLADPSVSERLNEFGQLAFNLHYKAFSKSDITEFINSVVIGGQDKMSSLREKFYTDHLVTPNHKTASQNIFDTIKSSITNTN